MKSALDRLVAISDGFTSGEASLHGYGLRTSAYIRELRLAGFPIETIWETTSDGSRVGRYRLSSQVETCNSSPEK